MDGGIGAETYLDDFRARVAQTSEACVRCGACFEACPMVAPAGLAEADPVATVTGILDILEGGAGTPEAESWSAVCTGSGNCIPACQYGVNPRFMVQLARSTRHRKTGLGETGEGKLGPRWRKAFQGMSRGVRVLSRLQLPPETLARLRDTPRAPGEAAPDVVFYTGCNVLKTPHIALLCLDVLDMLDISYAVMGGPGQCCGVYQFREGDFETNSKVAYSTIDGLASAGTSTVLSWCPSCQIQIGEVSLPNYSARFGQQPFDFNPFLTFLAGCADRLAAMMVNTVPRRVALHERPVFPEVMAAVRKLLSIVPGVEVVEIDVPRIGTQANSLAVLPEYKKALVRQELAAVADAGVDTLATIYHACHREICDAGDGRSFEIVNFMEILGEGLGLHHEDLFKRLKLMKDVDAVIVDTAEMIAVNGLDLDSVRDTLLAEFSGAAPAGIKPAR